MRVTAATSPRFLTAFSHGVASWVESVALSRCEMKMAA
jgi:hypothetical protein